MFQLNNRNKEMVFHISTTSHQQNRIPQDLIIPTRFTVGAHNNMGRSSQGRSTRKSSDNNNNYQNDDYKKKMIHRDIEKHRRKEMAAHYAGLRSLIPLEYIKGKRATSDQMNGAIDYIKQLKMRVTELGARRDDLKRSNINLSPLDFYSMMSTGSGSPNNSSTSTSVVVHPCSAGVEVVLSSSSSNSSTASLPLSRVLQVLLGEGLTVLTCATTKVNERLLHNIQAEVTDPTCIDFAQLQENLKETLVWWNPSS